TEGDGEEQGIADLLRARWLVDPYGKRTPPPLGQAVGTLRSGADLARFDEAGCGQAGQLPVDLAASQGPEVADDHLRQLHDLVAGELAEMQEPQQRGRCGIEGGRRVA